MKASAISLPLKNLTWETEEFGFSVAAITDPHWSPSELSKLLQEALKRGTKLVYWASAAELATDNELLISYQGLLADRKTTYHKTVIKSEAAIVVSEITLCETKPGEESPALIELGIAAGLWSRFAVDPRFPPDKFRALYETWMRRSLRREIATTVLVAEAPDSDKPLGMVTISLRDKVGQIGLIAVAEQQRGRGIGRLLISGADQWMREHGAQTAKVVTQGANAAACHLYESSGYTVKKIEYMYHFWV